VRRKRQKRNPRLAHRRSAVPSAPSTY
jgi:hypothetical protein